MLASRDRSALLPLATKPAGRGNMSLFGMCRLDSVASLNNRNQ